MNNESRIAALEKLAAQQDDRVDGLWLALVEIIDVFKACDPTALPTLLNRWRQVSRDYALARAGRPHAGTQTLQQMEPRALLHDTLLQIAATPPPDPKRGERKLGGTHAGRASGSRAQSALRRKPT